ncbi:hypothetical protein [Calothrix sp. PCC 6303]|uniref:hypothetical protein n=1 Tax=Calothrix sp. PCC 6303 TaxID=1170562 RepID=UPI0002A0138D|nr:hypothetical protein [Calothrix sp. PCC 6303]AFZ03976.1 hypothetical protein Cal6303_5087 [Calothrix sp. PCC 6303]
MNLLSRSASLFASALVLGAAAISAPAAFAADTADVPLAGTVVSTLDITATATGAAGALTLTPGVQQTVKVADLAIVTNNATGYTLTVTPGSNSELNTTGGTTPISYQVAVVGDNATAPTTFTATATTSSSNNTDTPQDLYIQYTPAAALDTGAYTGTIGLSVVDN